MLSVLASSASRLRSNSGISDASSQSRPKSRKKNSVWISEEKSFFQKCLICGASDNRISATSTKRKIKHWFKCGTPKSTTATKTCFGRFRSGVTRWITRNSETCAAKSWFGKHTQINWQRHGKIGITSASRYLVKLVCMCLQESFLRISISASYSQRCVLYCLICAESVLTGWESTWRHGRNQISTESS